MTRLDNLAALLLLTISCGRTAPTAEPERLSTNPPAVLTECASHPCWCDDPTLWAQAANHSNFPTGYPGNGSRLVTVVMPDSGLIHVWPGGLCGDILAASGLCWCMGGNFRESEMVRRTLHQWGPVATFRLVPSRAYWMRQGANVVPVPVVGDTVVIG